MSNDFGNDKKKARKRTTFLLAMLAAVLLMGIGWKIAKGEMKTERRITAYSTVTKWGQKPLRYQIAGQTLPKDVSAADFFISGEADGWGTTAMHPFSCSVSEIGSEGEDWYLVPADFPEKYFYVKKMTVQCEKYPELGFTLEEIAETKTETADLFTLKETENDLFKAWFYEPESESPLPVIIVFHGYGDTQNLLTYRTAVNWAEPEEQAVRPCIVIAPVIDDGTYFGDEARSEIFAQVLAWIDELTAAGKADPQRIYAMGNSFGGMSAIEIAEQYPERIAGVLALCPAVVYSRTALSAINKMKDVPLRIAHAQGDETIGIEDSRQIRDALEAAGGQVTLREYTDEEMEAAGAVHGSEQTYSFHHVELVVLENPENAEWLFQQSKYE